MVAGEHLSRQYQLAGQTIRAVDDLTLRIDRGEMVAIQGRSGSGKTTLLNLLGGLDRPTRGVVRFDGQELTSFGDAQLTELRRRRIGFIFQSFGLIPILSAAENVEVPLRLVNAEPAARRQRVAMLLEMVGLTDRARHRPHELSGGEQQRVAIARALANRPELLIADEPTGQLDSQSGRTIMRLVRAVARAEGVTVVVATHDAALVSIADRVVELRDGRLVSEGPASQAAAASPGA
ncbi:MAG: ABC transporter ATP-binding protein [Chloroflexota bacterium]|nr:ABC transporter ATP-binding protein [Chloroflexota bacterium]